MTLYEKLPDSVIVNGRRYKVNLEFRRVFRMMKIMGDQTLTEEAREWLALRCIMRRPRLGVLAEVKKLLFGEEKETEKQEERITSFEQDAGLIRAAFRQAYGIDLYREKLHWLEFIELVNGIPEGTRYSEIVGIRARPMPKPTKYNREEREWLMKAKQRYAIKMTEEEQQSHYERDVMRIFGGLMGMAKG